MVTAISEITDRDRLKNFLNEVMDFFEHTSPTLDSLRPIVPAHVAKLSRANAQLIKKVSAILDILDAEDGDDGSR